MFEKVSSERFYEGIGDKDVVLEVVEPYPYKTLFKNRRTGTIVGYEDRDGAYYLRKNAE